MSYINIGFHTSIIYGVNGAAVYDFRHMKMFDIDILESRILKELETGQPIESLYGVFPKENVSFMCESLTKTGIASIGDTFCPREPYREGAKNVPTQFMSFQLHRCFIELPYTCDNRCPHCNEPKLFGCFACAARQELDVADMDFYKKITGELIKYNCSQIYLYGGNLLQHWNDIKTLISLVRSTSSLCTVYIITPYDNVSKVQAAFLKETSTTLIMSVNWPNVNNIVSNASTIFNFNVSYDSYSGFKEYEKHLKEREIIYHRSIYSDKTGIKLDYVEEGLIKPIGQLANEVDNIVHPCMYGLLAIRADRKLYPCRNSQNPYDDLTITTLDSFFMKNEDFKQYWCSPVSGSCRECKYRKSCIDCRTYDLSVYNGLKESCKIAKSLS